MSIGESTAKLRQVGGFRRIDGGIFVEFLINGSVIENSRALTKIIPPTDEYHKKHQKIDRFCKLIGVRKVAAFG